MIVGIVIGLLVLILILLIIGFLLYRKYQNNKSNNKLDTGMKMDITSTTSQNSIPIADLTVMNTIHGLLFLFLSILEIINNNRSVNSRIFVTSISKTSQKRRKICKRRRWLHL